MPAATKTHGCAQIACNFLLGCGLLGVPLQQTPFHKSNCSKDSWPAQMCAQVNVQGVRDHLLDRRGHLKDVVERLIQAVEDKQAYSLQDEVRQFCYSSQRVPQVILKLGCMRLLTVFSVSACTKTQPDPSPTHPPPSL